MSDNHDDVVATLQTICHVSKDRAEELLGAASGSMERAVEIHFQQKPSVARAKDSNDFGLISIDDDDDDDESGELANTNFSNETSHSKKDMATKPLLQSPSKKPRKSGSASSGKPQQSSKPKGTLHAFFSPKKGAGSQKNATSPDRKIGSSTRKRSPVCTPKKKNNESKQSTSLNTPTTSPVKEVKRPIKSAETEAPVDPRLSYNTLSKAFTEMTSTTKRNAKLNTLKMVLIGVIEAVGGIDTETSSREADGQTLTCALELISGKISLPNSTTVAPVPLQVSGAAVSGALQIVTGGVSKARMRESYRSTGDLGDTAAEFFSPAVSLQNFFKARKKRDRADDEQANNDDESSNKGASIARIHSLLQSVATVKPGTGSQKERQGLLVKLLRLAASKGEMRFLVRILLGNMRLGATIKSILAALAMAVEQVQTGKETTPQCPAIQTLQKTHDICPRLSRIAMALLCGGVKRAVQDCTLEVGVPIQPMLANPAHSLEEVEKMLTKGSSTSDETTWGNEAIAEWKYDGMRCQAHFDGNAMKLFSRHLLDTTKQFPDAAQFMLDARRQDEGDDDVDGKNTNKERVNSFILDAEIVAVDPGAFDRLLPFQILSTRRGAKKDDEGVKIKVFVFDLMYLNGLSLLGNSLWERQKLLRESFQGTPGFDFASSLKLKGYNEAEISNYLSEAVKGGAEGLMVKLIGRACQTSEGDLTTTTKIPAALPCPYESGTRSATWLKLKRDYVTGFFDTIDVVPIGAWHGNGRKAEKGFLSPILFAVYDEEDGIFRSISRCMSFTDSMYIAIREFYFRGTPYPSDVGIIEGDSLKTKKTAAGTSATSSADADVKDAEVEGSDDEDMEGGEVNEEGASDEEQEDDDGNALVGVNCLPGRPPSSLVLTNENCSIWFKPSEVWEVSFADLSLSRTHTAAAGLVDDAEGRGVALRFPRFKRRRPDKSVEQATNCVQIAQLFKKQCKQC
ncbi:DNA ligase 1 [Seminavis robusta]|uniref:DNA ligase n=1 Tax=Seminavis robusta TaxID=568900 RepID=A0A9N8DCT9_9STRA|nr:DNA ligase 1 [Seminavis robusta]|eukprot:Sro37_g023080.1 DNA ligase 1 (966) ;mRNA; f:22752-25745